MQVIQNDVIKCCKMMSSNVVLLHSNNSCVVLEPAICEDLDLHVAIFFIYALFVVLKCMQLVRPICSLFSCYPIKSACFLAIFRREQSKLQF